MNRTQKKVLKGYDLVQAQHRAMRNHHWRVWKTEKGTVWNGERKRSWWYIELYCVCGVRKFFKRDSAGRKVTSWYIYPPEYSLADLGLDQFEIGEALWVLMLERELAQEDKVQADEAINEERAAQ